MSQRAQSIRDTALNIGLDLLKRKDIGTKAVRYFSRASMLGSIDMTDFWKGFTPLGEKPGEVVDRRKS